ncbi:MAG: DUF2569 domain-containing protein [Burkholderiales bacterium]|nr:DUF2569 domain-containing protein [Burkholderiales bacterium]
MLTKPPCIPPKTQLNHQAAEQSPAEGRAIGGWLMFLLFGLIAAIIIAVMDLINIRELTTTGRWMAMVEPSGYYYDPLWFWAYVFYGITDFAVIGFSSYLLYLFFCRSVRVPRLMVIWLIALFAIAVIDYVLATQIATLSEQGLWDRGKHIWRSIIGIAIWVPYFRRSMRVKQTFTRAK